MADQKVLIATIERNEPDIYLHPYSAEGEPFVIVDDLKPRCDSGSKRCQEVKFTMRSLTALGTALFSSIEEDA